MPDTFLDRARRRARHLVRTLARCGHIDMLHEPPAVAAEVRHLLEQHASREIARLSAEGGA